MPELITPLFRAGITKWPWGSWERVPFPQTLLVYKPGKSIISELLLPMVQGQSFPTVWEFFPQVMPAD